MGGGAALFDMDNDGFLDLYLVQSGNLFDPSAGTGNRLYRNRGNGTFEDVTEGSGAGVRGYGMGVAAGDFDNDGNTDLLHHQLRAQRPVEERRSRPFHRRDREGRRGQLGLEHERRVRRLRR